MSLASIYEGLASMPILPLLEPHSARAPSQSFVNRAVYDIHRLGIDDKYIEPLTTMLRVGDDGMCSVVALAVAARLSSQPAKFAFRMVRWVPWIAAAFTAFAMSTPFMTPAEQAVAAGGPRQVFLFPFLCECSFVCQETCGCIPLDIPSCIMLVLVSFPIYDNARVNLYFAMAAVVESKRIFKSISSGGALCAPATWPPRKYANGTAVASPSTKATRVPCPSKCRLPFRTDRAHRPS